MKKRLAAALLGLTIAALNTVSVLAYGFYTWGSKTKWDWGNGTNCYSNWVNYHDHWYYFGEDEFMRTGWIYRDDAWYFAADTGELQTGLMYINGNYYYFDSNSCKLYTGPRTWNGRTYVFTEYGVEGEQPYTYDQWNSNGTMIRGTRVSPSRF